MLLSGAGLAQSLRLIKHLFTDAIIIFYVIFFQEMPWPFPIGVQSQHCVNWKDKYYVVFVIDIILPNDANLEFCCNVFWQNLGARPTMFYVKNHTECANRPWNTTKNNILYQSYVCASLSTLPVLTPKNSKAKKQPDTNRKKPLQLVSNIITSFSPEIKPSRNLKQKHPHAGHCEVQQGQWRDLASYLCTNCLVWYAAKSPQQNTVELSVLQLIQVQKLAGSNQRGSEVCFDSGACLWTQRFSFVQQAPASPILWIPLLSSSVVQFCVRWPKSILPKI